MSKKDCCECERLSSIFEMIAIAKQFIRKTLDRLGYQIVKISHQSTAQPINVFPLVVDDFLARRGSNQLFFVQVGAHDGLHGDPIRPFVMRHHWKGILVEPQPKIFKRLVKNYQGQSQLAFENAAVGPADGTASLYTFKESPNLPDHASMLASFDKGRLVANGHGYKGQIEELAVPTLTVKTLLSKHGVKHIDLLQIDTEGFDFEIIKMFFAADVSPSIINFESGILSAGQMRECGEMFAKLGYRAITAGVDTIAYKQVNDLGFVDTLADEGYQNLKGF